MLKIIKRHFEECPGHSFSIWKWTKAVKLQTVKKNGIKRVHMTHLPYYSFMWYLKKSIAALKSHSNMSPLDLTFHVEWTILMQVKLKEKPFQTDPDPLSSWEHQHSSLLPALLPNTDLCCLSTKHTANNHRAQEQRRCNLDSFTGSGSEGSACLWRLGKNCISVVWIGITYGFGREFPSSRDGSGRCSAPHIHLHLNTSADT